MSNVKKIRGDAGENFTCTYLIEKGYSIVARNYRKKCGEIDIIAANDRCLAFVEVKTRKFNSMTYGYEAVNYSKRMKILYTTMEYLKEFPTDLSLRFDVADVIVTTDEIPELLEIIYYDSAFDGSGFPPDPYARYRKY